MNSLAVLSVIAVMAWVGVIFITGPYKYRIRDCIGIEGQVLAQVMDRKGGKYWLDRQPEYKEHVLPFIVLSKDALEESTELVKCPEPAWGKK